MENMRNLIIVFVKHKYRDKPEKFETYKKLVEGWMDAGLESEEVMFFLDHIIQREGSQDVSQSKEDFIRGWNMANEFHDYVGLINYVKSEKEKS